MILSSWLSEFLILVSFFGDLASGAPENADAENVPNPTISKVYTEQTAGESLPTANISKVLSEWSSFSYPLMLYLWDYYVHTPFNSLMSF